MASGWTNDVRFDDGAVTLSVPQRSKPSKDELLRSLSSSTTALDTPLVLHVLIVEDDPFTRRVYSSQFEQANRKSEVGLRIEIVFAASVSEALELLSSCPRTSPSWPPGIIILDVVLPLGVHGDEAIQPVRRLVGDKVVVACVSGHSQVKLVQRCLLLGADTFLVKPFSPENLQQLWMLWLGKHRNKIPADDIPSSPLSVIERSPPAAASSGTSGGGDARPRLPSMHQRRRMHGSPAKWSPGAVARISARHEVADHSATKGCKEAAVHQARARVATGEEFDGETLANSLVSVEERRLQILEENIGQWDLGAPTIWGMQELFGTDLLFFVLESSFRRLRLFEALAIDAGKLRALAEAISRGYRQLPYHNAVHACDVTHATAWLLLQTAPPAKGRVDGGGKASVTSVDGGGGGAPPTCVQAMPPYAVLAAMLAAAMHDINHDGHNNTYHQQSGSEWALTYNDKSILENMHCSTGLRLMRASAELDVLENLTLAERRNLRTLVVEAILGTDLSVHFEQLSQLQLKLDEGLKLSGDDNDLPLYLAFITHAADIGSTAKPAETYFNWAQRVFVEFFATGDLQKAAGYEVQPFMDREQASIAKAQQGFLKYICQPVFQAIATYCPAAKQTVAHCGHNIAVLQELEKRYHSTPDHGRGAMLQMELVELLPDFPLQPPDLSPDAAAEASVGSCPSSVDC